MNIGEHPTLKLVRSLDAKILYSSIFNEQCIILKAFTNIEIDSILAYQ